MNALYGVDRPALPSEIMVCPEPALVDEPVAVVQRFAARATISGGIDDGQVAPTGTTLTIGSMLSLVADATQHPFVCSAFADVALLPGPRASLRCAVRAGGLSHGLGPPPFPTQRRSSSVDLELRLLLPNLPGMVWRIDASAVVLPTGGLGNRRPRLLIRIDDADTDDIDWSCLAFEQVKTLCVRSQRDIVPIRIRVVGQSESCDATTLDQFLTQLMLDLTPRNGATEPRAPAARREHRAAAHDPCVRSGDFPGRTRVGTRQIVPRRCSKLRVTSTKAQEDGNATPSSS